MYMYMYSDNIKQVYIYDMRVLWSDLYQPEFMHRCYINKILAKRIIIPAKVKLFIRQKTVGI